MQMFVLNWPTGSSDFGFEEFNIQSLLKKLKIMLVKFEAITFEIRK